MITDDDSAIDDVERSEYGLYIDGEWRDSQTGSQRPATNPATGRSIGTLTEGTREDAQLAIDAANATQPDLGLGSPFDRAELCHEMGAAIEAHADHLTEWLTRDQGKPLEEAATEVELCAQEFHNAAEDVKRLETEILPSEDPDKRIYTVRQPHGVYGIVTPWNYPLNIPAEYIAPGIAAGNALVWVPAPSTSMIAAKLMEVLDSIGLPDGVLNLVTGPGPVVGNEVVRNEGTDAVGFTGSPETGAKIHEAAGPKPMLLEMGGNGPVIVLDDADLEAAVECTATGCFSNAGQICSASERILVHEAVHDEFVERLQAKAESLHLGDPTESNTDMGPLNNEGVAEKMDRHVADAVEKGATVLTGGGRAEHFETDLYYEPTVIEDVTPEMAVNREESFGPIAPVIPFSEYDEAIRITNDIELGLTSSVFTSNIQLLNYFTERIQTGIVNVNDSSSYWEIHTPFGGYSGKDSGVGRLGGKYTIEQMTQVKNIVVDHANVDSPL